MECVWQFEGQWCRTSDQVSPLAGRSAPVLSVACPLKEIVSPTAHVSEGAGVSMTGTGNYGFSSNVNGSAVLRVVQSKMSVGDDTSVTPRKSARCSMSIADRSPSRSHAWTAHPAFHFVNGDRRTLGVRRELLRVA